MFPFYVCGTRGDVNVIADKAPDKIQKTIFAQTIPYLHVNSYQPEAAHNQTKDNEIKPVTMYPS
jgi:hypothetical protein